MMTHFITDVIKDQKERINANLILNNCLWTQGRLHSKTSVSTLNYCQASES